MFDIANTNLTNENTLLHDFLENRARPAANSVVFDFDCSREAHAEQAPLRGGAQAPQGAELVNGGATYTPPPSVRSGESEKNRWERSHLWGLRDLSAKILRPADGSRGPSVCGCGYAACDEDGAPRSVGVALRENGTARVSGTLSCKSGWVCAVCAPAVTAERQRRVADVFEQHVLQNKRLMLMLTLTIGHTAGQSLEEVMSGVNDRWRAVRQGQPWARGVERHKILGVITAPETTWSREFGWHYHLHIGVVLDIKSGDRAQAIAAGEWMRDRYVSLAKKRGLNVSVDAQDVTLPQNAQAAADYMAKGQKKSEKLLDLSWELSGGMRKNSHSVGSYQPFDILSEAAHNPQFAHLWREFSAAFSGVRSCVISAELIEKIAVISAAVAREKMSDPDGELPAADYEEEEEELGGGASEGTVLGTLPAAVWNGCVRLQAASGLLSILERRGASAWPDVVVLAYDIAGVPLPNRGGAGGDADFRSANIVSLSGDDLVDRVRRLRLRNTNLSAARALDIVLSDQRSHARRTGKMLVLPPLRAVMNELTHAA